jgi:hypothetical protein
MILADFSAALPDLTHALSHFGSASSNLLRTRTAPYIATELGPIPVELSQIPAQFYSISEQFFSVGPNLPMRRSIVSRMAETTCIRRGLIREYQDRNGSSAEPNDGVFFIHKHLLGHLDARG